jgi:hypothetical protein
VREGKGRSSGTRETVGVNGNGRPGHCSGEGRFLKMDYGHTRQSTVLVRCTPDSA